MKKIVIGFFIVIAIYLLFKGEPFYDQALKAGVNGWRKIWGGLVNV